MIYRIFFKWSQFLEHILYSIIRIRNYFRNPEDIYLSNKSIVLFQEVIITGKVTLALCTQYST